MRRFLLLFTVAIGLLSCSKESGDINGIEGQISFILNTDDLVNETKSSIERQDIKISYDKTNYVMGSMNVSEPKETAVKGLKSSNGGNKSYTPVRSDLAGGTYYRIAIYNSNNVYVLHRDYAVGTPTSEVFTLKNGTYKFIAYSVGSTDASKLPVFNTTETLNNLTVPADGNGKFMYYSKDLVVNGQDETITVVLRHIFSKINVNINTTLIGQVQAASATVKTHYNNAVVSLSNGTVKTYQNLATNGKAVTFGGVNTNDIFSQVSLNSPQTATGTMALTMKLNGRTKTINVDNLKITPSVSYDLNLTLGEGIPQGNLIWAIGNLSYSPSNGGTYFFADDQEVLGDYWIYNYQFPKNRVTGLGWIIVALLDNYDSQRDPCRRVGDGSWRTPSESEIQTLFTNNSYGVKNGVKGFYVGNGDVFLPYTGLMEDDRRVYQETDIGAYWTRTNFSLTNAMRVHFGGQSNQSRWTQFNNQYKFAGQNIRCVKTK